MTEGPKRCFRICGGTLPGRNPGDPHLLTDLLQPVIQLFGDFRGGDDDLEFLLQAVGLCFGHLHGLPGLSHVSNLLLGL